MKEVKNREYTIKEILESPSSFIDVKVSRQFKEKVLQQLFDTKKGAPVFSWFTPKLQFAAIALVFIVNSLAITYIANVNYATTIDTFSKTFNINDYDSFLN